MSKKYCLITAFTLLAALNSPAASGNWINNASSVWSAATNWSSNPTVPGTAAGDTVGLTFDITANRTVTIDTTSRTVGTLNIGDPTSSYFVYTLAASGGANLTFNNNGSGALLAKPTAANTALDLISAPIVLADNLTIDTAVTGTGNSGNSIQINGVISESGARTLTKNGVGGVYFNNSGNTYSAGTILNAGEIQFSSSMPFGTGPLTINGGSLAARVASRTLTNALTVGGDFTFNSANAGGNGLTLIGNVDLGATTRTITVASSANPSAFMSGIISGGNPSVGLIKAGASTFNISGSNTFSGDTRIAAGSLQLSLTTGGPAGTSLALQNSTVDLNAADAGTLSFRGSVGTVAAILGGLKGSRNQSLLNTTPAAVALTVGNNGQSTTYSGILSGAGGSLIKIGAGTLILSGANTYDGATTISQGSLQLGDGGASGSLSSSSTIVDNGNLTINRNNAVAQGTDFSGSDISGTGSFTQAGTGTTTFTVGNSYAGTTTVSAGKLVVRSDQTGTGAASVADGAALGINTISGQWQPATLTLGTSAGCTLEFNSVANPGTTTAPLNPGSVTRNGTVTVHVKSISGVIAVGGSGYPLLGNMAGSTTGYTLGTQPPGVSGHLAVSGSTLTFVVDTVSDIWNAASPGGNWDVLTTANWTGNAANNTPANTYQDGDSVLFNDTVAGPQAVTVTAAVTPGPVNVDNTATEYSITSSGANAIGGATALAKSGSGTLTLSGPNTYSGGTTLSSGQLNINDGGTSSANSAIGTGPLTITGGTLGNTGAGDVTMLPNNPQNWNGNFGYAGTGFNLNLGTGAVTPNASRQINVSANTLTVGGVIGGGAISLTKTGNGILTLSGANTFSGGTTLSAGQLNINNGGSSSANSAIGTGTLTINGGTIDNTSGGNVTLLPNNAQVWGGNFSYTGTANSLNLGTGPVTLTGTRTVNVDANTLTVGGIIGGAFGITKTGAGTLVLLNANTYGNNGASDTLVNGGTLAIGNDLALGTSRLNFGEGSTVQSTDGTARTITNALNFGGNTTFAGTGNLLFTRSAANSTPKTMTVNNPVTEFSGVLSGAMSRTVAGTGKLIFSGANTYSQGTTINPGATLQLGNGGTTGSLSTSGAIVNDGTLIFNRSDALAQGTHFSTAPITGGGTVVQAGSGTTTLTAANTYSGGTFINNGGMFITPAHQAGGDVTVANGASFGVSAGAVTNSAVIGNLALGTGGATTLDFSYTFVGNPTNAALQAGTVTINGTSAIRIGGSFTVGTFPVLKYGSLPVAFASTVDGPRGVAATLSNDVVNQVLYVTVSSVGSGIVWTGTNSVSPNLWDLNTTTNWLIGGLPTDYQETVPPGDAVTFNDAGSGSVLLSNTASPARVTINNAAVNYTFQGSGSINSSAGLTKTGAGSVTMNVAGIYSGSTVLSNGTFSIGANQTVANLSGNSTVTASAGTPTLTVNNSSNTTFTGSISGIGTLTKTGNGVLTLPASNSVSVNVFVRAGTLTLDSGAITAGSFASVAQGGTENGTLTLQGTANFTGNNDFNVGDVGSSVGTLNIQDNASLTVSSFYVASANAAGSTAAGTVNQNGGTVTQTSTATGSFAIGGRNETSSVGAVGVYNLNAGTLTSATAIRLGGGGTGTFNQNGGLVNVAVDINLARFAGSSGTYNLNGGTLRSQRVTSSTAINAIFNLNGGVLLASQDNTGIITNVPTIQVRNGGAVIDTTNFNVTIYGALQHSAIGGDNAIDGGLTKRGTGTLTLNESFSSYTGPTVVTGGELKVLPGSVAASLNSLTLSNGALGLALNGGVATYSATDLKLAGNSTFNLNYDLISGTPVTALNVGGGVNVSGTTTINVSGNGWTVGQFTLVDYTGTPLANLSNFQLSALPYGVSATLSNNTANTSLDLVVTAVSPLPWIPLVASDAFGTSSFNAGNNWLDFNAPSSGNGYFTRGFTLRSPADSNAYTFGGAVLSVDPTGQLLLKGTDGQVVTISDLRLNGGILVYGVSTSDNFIETLAGAVTLQTGLTSLMAVNGSAGASETLNVTAPVGGSGNLQINNESSGNQGTVVLAANNTYSGNTTVGGGTLLINGVNASPLVTVNTNATLGGSGTLGGTVTVQPGGRLAPGVLARGALTNSIGTLTASGAATISGAVVMKIDRNGAPNSDKFVAPAITVNAGASLTVTNIGSTNLATGDTFTLFSTPVGGSFASVTLPPLPDNTVYWTNKLAIDGTIAVVSASTVNPTPTNITFSAAGGNLTISWPTDRTGWTLQVQTNSRSVGLNTNWFDVSGSATTNSVTLPMGSANGAVFYRLKL